MKRFLTVLLTVALLLSCLPALPVYVQAEAEPVSEATETSVTTESSVATESTGFEGVTEQTTDVDFPERFGRGGCYETYIDTDRVIRIWEEDLDYINGYLEPGEYVIYWEYVNEDLDDPPVLVDVYLGKRIYETVHVWDYEGEEYLAPTCSSAGYRIIYCYCGEEYEKVTYPPGHNFTYYVSDNNATCTADGTKTAECSRCGATDTVTVPGTALGHSFTNYISNNDATMNADGTKTAKCDRCNATHTVTDVGSKKESISGSCGENARWELTADGNLTISGTGAMTNYEDKNAPWYSSRKAIKRVVIDSGVTSIGDSAFYDCTNLTSVTIPDSVTTIGDSAFYYCYSLTSVTIPDRVVFLGAYAFYNCSRLTSITIPKSISTIDSYTFYGCTRLTSIIIPKSVVIICDHAISNCTNLTGIWVDPDNPYYSNDAQGVLFDKKQTKLIQTPGKLAGHYQIPNGVVTIGDSAFYKCTGLTSVTIPDSVTTIGNDAFNNCTGLTSVTIPDSVTTIGNYAFANCTGPTSITIPDSVTTIGIDAFAKCTGLTSVTIPDSVTTIGDGAFAGCSSLESITIPFVGASRKSASNTYQYPFGYIFGTSFYTGCVATKQYYYGYSTYTTTYSTYYIPAGLKNVTVTGGKILFGAFYNCTGLTSITIPDSVSSISGSAFYNCASLTSITIPDSVSSISGSAFYNCTGLTSITIPDSVTAIGDGAFAGCSSLESITIPFVGASRKSASNTYQYPFGYIFGTSSYTGGVATKQYYYGSSTSTTTSSTYYIPAGLKNVTVTGGEILYCAFYNCTSLTSVTIGDSVSSISGGAFFGCSSLEDITIPFVGGSKKSASDTYQYPFGYIFGTTAYTGGVARTQHYYGSSTSTTTYSTYYIPAGLKNVTVTGGEILYGAFYYCTSLTSITIPDSVTTIGASAFFHCTSLTGVTIPDSVTAIGSSAFSNCTDLTSITIPDSVTTIGNYAFDCCDSLTSITIPDSVTTIGDRAFSNCTGLTSITIPDGVTTIGDDAFYRCTGLTGIWVNADNQYYTCDDMGVLFDKAKTKLIQAPGKLAGYYQIPDSVTTIGNDAFSWCTGLTSITIPDSVTTIGNYAFRNCSSLISITIPDRVTTIGNYAFYDCTGLRHIAYSGTQTQWGAITIGSYNNVLNSATRHYEMELRIVDTCYEFSVYCPACNRYVVRTAKENGHSFIHYISNGDLTCTTDGTKTAKCSRCDAIDTVVDPEALAPGHRWDEGIYTEPTTKADGFTTYTCIACGENRVETNEGTKLTGGTCGDNLTWTFADGTLTITGTGAMDDFTYDTATKVSDVPWHDYIEQIQRIEIASGITTIGKWAFRGCSNLTEIQIPNSVTVIGSSSFWLCTGLTQLHIPSKVHTIGGYAFYKCSSLTELVIPSGVAEIPGSMCYQNTALKSITIPAGVVSIGNSAFRGCSNLTDVYFGGDQAVWNAIAIGTNNNPVTNATLHITETPVEENAIVANPESVNVNSGAAVTFTVDTTGQVASYQWQYRKLYKWFDTSMEGCNTATLTVPATGARNGYDYRCVITFADGTVLTTEPAKLTVNTCITNVQNPNDQTVVLGSKGQFTASAIGEGLKYQWQYCRSGSEKWIDTAMEGATKATVYIESTTARDGYTYRCRITDIAGVVVYTEPATLRVLSFASQPAEAFAATGSTVTFSVTTNVAEGFTYQWQYRRSATANWTNTTMTGYNTATLTVAATKARNGYEYRCVLTGAKNGKIESKAAVLHVGDAVAISGQPQDVTCTVGGVATFTVTATNAYSYQWQYMSPAMTTWRSTSADGNTTATLNVTVKSNNNGYKYRCVISGLDGSETVTGFATLTVG